MACDPNKSEYNPITSEQISAAFRERDDTVRESMKEKLELAFTVSQIMSSFLQGVALAAVKCADNSDGEIMCIAKQKQDGGSSITDPDSVGAGVLDSAQDVIMTARNLTLKLFTQLTPVVLDVVEGKYAHMSADDAAAPMIEDLNKQAEMFEALAKNKEFQEALKEWAEAYATVGVQAISESKPAVDEILENFWEAANGVIVKSTVGAINTGMNLTEAALGEIPVVGGFIALIMAFLRGINQGMLAAAPAVKSTTANTIVAGETAKRVAEKTGPDLERAAQASEALAAFTQTPDSQSDPAKRTEKAGKSLGTTLGDHLRTLHSKAKGHAAALHENVTKDGGLIDQAKGHAAALHEKATEDGGWIDQAKEHAAKAAEKAKTMASDLQEKSKKHQKTAQDLATAARDAQTNPTTAAAKLAVKNPGVALTATRLAAKQKMGKTAGGARRTRNKLKRKITRATRRLERSLARFTRRRRGPKKRRTRNRR